MVSINIKVLRTLAYTLLTIGHLGCGGLKTMYHPEMLGTRPSQIKAYKPSHMSLWFLDFYNNESLTRFEPEVINYSQMVNIDRVGNSLEDFFSDAHGINIILPPKWALYDSLELNSKREEMYIRLRTEILPILDVALKNRALSKFKEFEWFNVQDDTITQQLSCVIVGLESVTRKNGEQNYLRSGLGIVLFREDGRYYGMAVSEYNFTRYTSVEMLAQAMGCIERMLGLPSGVALLDSRELKH